MSRSGQSGTGKIRLFDDFAGPEIPIAITVAELAAAGYALGPFKVTGDLVNNDAGVYTLDKSSGYIRVQASAHTDADGAAIGTNVVFSPVLNGPLVLETRVEMAALTTKNVFIGFCTANADQVAEPITSLTGTITKVVPSIGFHLDSTLSSATYWHMPYLLATDTTQTSASVISSQVCVIEESDILRLEIDPNGAARWYINGKLEQSVGAGLGATTTTLLAGIAGVWAKSTAASIDLDYLLIEANRDWTR
jgi:hypothetical protein